MEMGRVEKVDLRKIRENEARDFIPWLEDNIEVLSESLGVKLDSPEAENGIGAFKADILAEDDSGSPAVIEPYLKNALQGDESKKG